MSQGGWLKSYFKHVSVKAAKMSMNYVHTLEIDI